MSDKRILIVDDEQGILDLLVELLEGNGFVVDAALTASAALDFVRANIYDAAILDFNLPDMDGVMLHRQLRQMDEELAANTLFTSGLVQSDDHLGYYSAFGSGFIAKPFDVQDVLDALRALWADAD
jgi:DNA-binding response OmpR family regulator